MPKVQYTEKKGLVQTSGAGVDLTLGSSSEAHEMTTSFKVQTETFDLPAQASALILQLEIPKCSILTSAKFEVLTPDTTNRTITELKSLTDDTLISGVAFAVNALGEKIVTPAALESLAADTTLKIALSGNTTGDGVVKLTVSYLQLS